MKKDCKKKGKNKKIKKKTEKELNIREKEISKGK